MRCEGYALDLEAVCKGQLEVACLLDLLHRREFGKLSCRLVYLDLPITDFGQD